MKYTIAKLASAAGVSVRTLHYYDEIGLLTPRSVEENGYRYYGQPELLRLQQIMFFRELEFPLAKIKLVLDSPDFDNISALTAHRAILVKQKSRLSQLIKTLDNTINNIKKGVSMTTNDLYGGFTKQQMEEYQKEAESKWGNTEAFKQSTARVKQMGPAGLRKIMEEGKAIESELASLIGQPVGGAPVQAAIAKHRAQIAHFYDVSDEMYRGLAQMYLSDPRFTKHYEDIAPGLAQFMHDAMMASLN